ncbi:MAG: NnrU family protein [Hyphomicrobiales bacterium]
MILLIVGIIAFLGIHMLPSFTHVREGLIGRLGETGYRIVFSVLSIVTFVLLVWAFAKAPVIQIWSPPPWTRWVAIVLMLPAFIFLVAAYVPGRIKATVKHPFLVAIKTWALAHLIANGDLASILLFGSFLAYAVYDRITLKGRKPTELIGTAAQGGTRNDLIAVVFGVVFYVVFLVWLHPLLIGRAVLPH